MERKNLPVSEPESHALWWHRPGSVLTLLAAVASTAACGGGDSAATANPASYSTTVTWTPPSFNTDGSALTDIAGFRVRYGTSPSNCNTSVLVSATATSTVIDNLSVGTYYFEIAVLNSAGLESRPSNAAASTVP